MLLLALFIHSFIYSLITFLSTAVVFVLAMNTETTIRCFIYDWTVLEEDGRDKGLLFAKSPQGIGIQLYVLSLPFELFKHASETSHSAGSKCCIEKHWPAGGYQEEAEEFVKYTFSSRASRDHVLRNVEPYFTNLPLSNQDDVDVSLILKLNGPRWYDVSFVENETTKYSANLYAFKKVPKITQLETDTYCAKESEASIMNFRVLVFDIVFKEDDITSIVACTRKNEQICEITLVCKKHQPYTVKDALIKFKRFIIDVSPDVVCTFDLGSVLESLERVLSSKDIFSRNEYQNLLRTLFSKSTNDSLIPKVNKKNNSFRGYGIIPIDLSQHEEIYDVLYMPCNHGKQSFEPNCSLKRCKRALFDMQRSSIIEQHCEICLFAGVTPTAISYRHFKSGSHMLKPTSIMMAKLAQQAKLRQFIYQIRQCVATTTTTIVDDDYDYDDNDEDNNDIVCNRLGGKVLSPVKGFFLGTIEMRDFCSAYPSVAIAFNIDSTTMIHDEKHIDFSDGWQVPGASFLKFVGLKSRKGLLPCVLDHFLNLRKLCIDQNKSKQLKLCSNACIGAMAIKNIGRLNPFVDAKVNLAIVSTLHYLLERRAIATANFKHKYLEGAPQILYGDTDSLISFYPTYDDITDDQLMELFDDADKYHDASLEQEHGRRVADWVVFQFESQAQRLILSDKKKQYAGFWRKRRQTSDGFTNWQMKLTGICKSNMPIWINEVVEEFFYHVLVRLDGPGAFEFLLQNVQELASGKVLPYRLARRKFSRSFTKKWREQVKRGSMRTNLKMLKLGEHSLLNCRCSFTESFEMVNPLYAAARYRNIDTSECYEMLVKLFIGPSSTWNSVIAEVLLGADFRKESLDWSDRINDCYQKTLRECTENKQHNAIHDPNAAEKYECAGCFTTDVDPSQNLTEWNLRALHCVLAEKSIDKNTRKLFFVDCTDVRCESSQRFLRDVFDVHNGMS